MKIIHTGDIHIGGAFQGLPKAKAELRKAELIANFTSLCNYAKQTGVDAVIIAGDLFDKKEVSQAEKREVFSAVKSAYPVPFYFVSGNHDGDTDIRAFAPENFYTFDGGFAVYELGEGVSIGGCDFKNLSTQNIPVLPKDGFNIVALHGDLQTEIPLRDLQGKNIDYLALGHIHKPTPIKEKLDARGFYRYCGSLEGRGFDELGSRGFFLLEIERGRLQNERFLSFATRSVNALEVDISACQTYTEVEVAVKNALQNIPKKDMIKITLCGKHAPYLRKDIPLLQARLLEEYFFVKVEDASSVFVDYRAYENDLTERGEFIREVGRYEMNERLRAEILEVGLKALNGEEIDL